MISGNAVTIYPGASNGFGAPVSFLLVSGTASAIAAGDINGDGHADLIVASTNSGHGSVSIYLGNGKAGFQLAQTYASGMNPVRIAIADLNGDGKPDLAICDNGCGNRPPQAGGLLVMLSQGAGAFADPVSYAAGSWPVGIVSGDLNGDGKIDLALASNTVQPNGFFDGTLAVFLGSGSGAFSPATFVGIDSGAVGIVLTDFNLDGVPDILVTNCCGLNDVNLLLGNGDGTFQGIEMAAGDSLEGIAVADFNGDRKPDLVIATQASDVAGGLHGYVTVFLNLPYAGRAATAVNAASFINGPVAPGSIASAFGIDLATASGETQVQFVDSAGSIFPSQVFAAASGQVNFQVPSGAQSSVGTSIFTSGDGKTSLASTILSPVAPGIFTVPGGAPIIAGGVLRVHADGTRTTGSTAQCGANGSCTAVPINLNPKTDTVYLILYATGLRGAAQSQVTVKIGNTVLSPTYAGAQGSFVGLDQIDVILPNSLKGAGTS